jgi:hypothetical protein
MLIINVKEILRGNQEWTIQGNRQHWVHKAQDTDKQSKNTTQKTKKMRNTDPTKKTGGDSFLKFSF